jgi:hypothetical protein
VRSAVGLLLGGVLVTGGCYRYVPLETTTPPLGETMLFHITDRGRVGLSDRFGAGLVRVEGRLTSIDARDYVMNVFRIAQLDGARSMWSGESVRLDREFVGQVHRRQLSRSRTLALAGVITAAAAALVASTNLIGAFSGDDEGEPPVDPISSLVGRVVMGRLVAGRLGWGGGGGGGGGGGRRSKTVVLRQLVP